VFDILFGQGISRSGELLDLAVDSKIVDQSGSWFAFGAEKLGQGKEKVRALLDESTDLRNSIEQKVVAHLGMHPREFAPTREDMDEGALEEE
jgi:recombination protein RecA